MSAPSEDPNQKSENNSVPLNPNYKTVIRIRPSETATKNIEIVGGNTIILKDKPPQSNSQTNIPMPPSKDKEENNYKFGFNSVLDANASQDTVFKLVSDHCLGKFYEGQNACVISYGQTNAGKSYAIFGEDEHFSSGKAMLDMRKDRKGIVPRCLEGILRKAKDVEDIREFAIMASFYELYLDNIRDLGKGLSDKHNALNGYESEKLEIVENSTNGQFSIKGLTSINIKHMNDLYDLLSAGFSLREKAEAKGTQISNRAHTILSLTLTQKDKENENLPFVNSSIYFVDLAGSERLMKAGPGNDALKNQENIIINSNLSALGKCLLSIAQTATKNIPYKDATLTRLLQNCLNSICNVCLFAHLIQSDANFEENLSTLRFADRTKNTDLKGRLSMLDDSGFGFGGLGSSDKMIKKLTEEINENKAKHENLQKDSRTKMNELQKILGLEVDLDKLITKPNEKDLKNFKLQREALKELENLKTMKKELEVKIEKQYRKMDILKIHQKEKEDKYYAQISKLKELNKQLKEQIVVSKVEGDDQIRNLNKQRNEELKHVILNANNKLDEKCHPLLFRQNIMESLQNEKSKMLETKKNKIYEDQRVYQDEVVKLKNQYQAILKNMKDAHDHLLEEKNTELQVIIDESKDYLTKKREERELYKAELLDLNEIALKQHNLIERIEIGEFSGGLKSFNIPHKEKPIYPNKLKHTLLHKYLEQNQIQKLSKTAAKESLISKDEKKDQTKTETTSSKQKTTVYGFEVTQTELARIESDNIDVNVNVNKLDEKYLVIFCKKLQETLKNDVKTNKELEDRLNVCEEIKRNHDIAAIIREKEDYKAKYLTEWKKNNQARVVLESQKRLITSPSFVLSTKSKTTDFPSKLRSSTSENRFFLKSSNKF